MENNIIQMAASAGHAVAYTIGSILRHIIDYVQLTYCVSLFGLTKKIAVSITVLSCKYFPCF